MANSGYTWLECDTKYPFIFSGSGPATTNAGFPSLPLEPLRTLPMSVARASETLVLVPRNDLPAPEAEEVLGALLEDDSRGGEYAGGGRGGGG
eukprot:CAMPEP_0177558344 /NCGR_PEP_ID=MMETSP0369-20130122/70205_1 /TAXON_ID=447022 ORGANISM="Scrippsiella hangoei-like, Strain SHHI-4" /NCGR_SAMPLE_ID=MMETSP0369 /ASSEMBLY_ACC=CAM_ASM_000364 /LENGTH=92 /DNA_ID=CAMNT_0019044905 /DNA_START=241 /DNA_END=515 /DNA_ORIENTATION=+